MKTFALFLLTLLVIAASIAPAFGADNKSLKKEFKALYAKQVAVGKTRDVKALMEFNTPDYSVKLLNGSTLSRKQLEQGMSRYLTSGQLVRQISFSYRILETTLNGEEVVVLVEQRDKRIQMRRASRPGSKNGKRSWRAAYAGHRNAAGPQRSTNAKSAVGSLTL